MLDFIIYHSQTTLIVLILIGCILKFALFFLSKSKNDKLKFLFFYPVENILQTHNMKRQELKNFQNILTILIVSISILFFVVTFLISQQVRLSD